MAKEIPAAVREVCLAFPESEEVLSHGSPNFRVRGKTFAAFTVNHHGDGRVSLWLNAPRGAQEMHVGAEPKYFFVPPYVGPRGWLGVHLDKGLSWKRIAALVRSAYENSAPRALADKIGRTIEIKPPKPKMSAEAMDPMRSRRAQAVLKGVDKIVRGWPEVSQDRQFGAPVWKAGKKTFLQAWYSDSKLKLGFWVGIDRQGLLTADRRFEIPPYMGHIGWIALDVTKQCDWDEVRALARDSYRHFALKRMLTQELK